MTWILIKLFVVFKPNMEYSVEKPPTRKQFLSNMEEKNLVTKKKSTFVDIMLSGHIIVSKRHQQTKRRY